MKPTKLIAFLGIFTVLAVGITFGCIQMTLREPAAEELPVEQGIDLNGFYDENDLLITEEVGDNLDVQIIQIDGLKNTEVRDAVNAAIRVETERVLGVYASMGTNLNYLTWQVYGSFSNVLSIGLFSGDDAQHYERSYLNFNLNDGSLLRLEDLFAARADLQMIVHSAFYDAVTRGNLGNHYWEQVNSPDEQELYETVKGYLGGEAPAFSFSPVGIYLYYGDYTATVPMADHAEDIVVYTKFLSAESLFTHDGVGYDGIFTCAEVPDGYDHRDFGFGAENFWYDIALLEPYVDEGISEPYRGQFLDYCDRVYAQLQGEMELVLAEAAANPDKGYILLYAPNVRMVQSSEYVNGVWENTPSYAAVVEGNYRLYEMPIELFHSKYIPALTAEYRDNSHYIFYGGIDEYLEGSEVVLTHRVDRFMADCRTREEITADTLFADHFDLGAAIRANAKYDLMSMYGYTMEAAELAVQGAWCELKGDSLEIYIPEWGTEQCLYMALGDFPDDALTIFE